MVKNSRFFLTIVCSMLLVVSNAVYAQESIENVYSQIDQAFDSGNSQLLNDVLSKNAGSKDYILFESYTLKKTRQMIIANKLSFAREASLCVIDNNLENFDAVELYSYIDRAMLNEEALRQAQLNRQRLEEERLAEINAKAKLKIEKSSNYSNINTTSGSSVYINEAQQSYTSLAWNIDIGVADLFIQNITKPEAYSSAKYGVFGGVNLFNVTDQFVIGCEGLFDLHILALTGTQEVVFGGRFVPMLSFESINKNLFMRVGFAGYKVNNKTDTTTDSIKDFMTPVLGIGFENVMIGSAKAGFHYDYYLGHTSSDDIKTSMEAGASILIPMAVTETSQIGFKLGLSDMLFIKNEGLENRCKAIFAIGVGNVSK